MLGLKARATTALNYLLKNELLREEEPGMVAYTCNLSIQGVETGRSRVLGHLWLYSKFEASLGYVRP